MLNDDWKCVFLAALLLAPHCEAACPNLCNNRGLCGINNVCICHEGFTGPDCSRRSCPFGVSWADKATAIDTAHADAECSGAGLCDSFSGECRCYDGFTGHACQRSTCHNNCMNRGQCISMADLAVYYGRDYDPTSLSAGDGFGPVYTNWEKHSMLTCKCDYGFFGPDCSLIMCPKGDDPVTVNQAYRQIQLDVVDGGGSGAFTGLLGISFQGETSFITLGAPSSDNCETVLEASAKFGDVTCAYTSVSDTIRRFDITFISWPTFPQENNLYFHSGNPASTEFLCDVTKTDSRVQCTFSDVVSTNLREYEYCSGRGTCDFKTGNCLCATGFGGIACDAPHTAYFQSTNAHVFQEVAVKSADFNSSAVNIRTAKSSAPDFNLLKASSNSPSKAFTVRGDGVVSAGSLRVIESGVTVARGGIMVERGGLNVSNDGAVVANAEASSPLLSVQSTDAAFDDTVLEIRSMGYTTQEHYLLRAINQDFTRFSVRGDGLLGIADAGLHITGGLSVGGGGLKAKGGVTIFDEGLSVTGGVTVVSGVAVISDGVDVFSLGLKVVDGTTLDSGGLSISQGGLGVELGGETISSGGIEISAGGVTVVSGGLLVTGGVTILTGGMKATHGGSVHDVGMQVTDGLSVVSGGTKVTVSGVSVVQDGVNVRSSGLSVQNLGVRVTGGMSVSSGLAVDNHGVSVTADGVKVAQGAYAFTGGINVEADGALVTGGMSALGSGMKVSGGATVDAGGVVVLLGGTTVSAAGLKAAGGFTISSVGLQVDLDGMEVTGGVTESSGGVTVGAGVTVEDTGLFVSSSGGTITAGGLKVADGLSILSDGMRIDADGLTVDGGVSVGDLGLYLNGGVTVESNGLYVVDTGMTVPTAGMTVAEGVSVLSDGVLVNSGGVKVVGGITLQDSGFVIPSGLSLTITDVGLAVDGDGVTVAVDGMKVAGGVAVTGSGADVHVGGVNVAGGVSVSSDGLTVDGGLTVTDTGLEVLADGASITGGGMKVDVATTVEDVGVHVDSNGAYVFGGLLVQDSGVKVKDGLTISDTGLVVNSNGATISGLLTLDGGLTVEASDLVIDQNMEINGLWGSVTGAKVKSGLTLQDSSLTVNNGVTIIGDVFVGQSMTITGNLYGTTHIHPSDRRLKTDIEPLKRNLESVTKLRGVYFNWREDSAYANETKRQIGVIAQDVQAVFPDATSSILNDEYMGVDYIQLIPVLIEAVRELHDNFLELSDTYDELDARTSDCNPIIDN